MQLHGYNTFEKDTLRQLGCPVAMFTMITAKVSAQPEEQAIQLKALLIYSGGTGKCGHLLLGK